MKKKNIRLQYNQINLFSPKIYFIYISTLFFIFIVKYLINYYYSSPLQIIKKFNKVNKISISYRNFI